MDDLDKIVKNVYTEKFEALDKSSEDYKKTIKEFQQAIKQIASEKKKLIAEQNKVLKELKTCTPEIDCFELSVKDSIKLDEETVQKANEWIKLHEVRYHTATALGLKDPKYQGAIAVSKYFIRKGWTSIGDFVELYCETCMTNYKNNISDSEDYRISLMDTF